MSDPARITIEPAGTEQAGTPKRRQYSIAVKRGIVEESYRPGASVARVARTHGVNAHQVFSWRRLYRRGRLGGAVPAATNAKLLPVTITEPTPARVPASLPASLPMGAIQLQLSRGKLRIEGSVDPESLRLVLECLLA